MNKKPPKIAGKLLKIFLKEHLRDAHIGDFEEIYNDIYEEKSVFKANLWYWFQVFKSFPGVLYNTFYWRLIMLKNYFIIALRNIRKKKLYSFLNITGLSIGMACCILILLWVRNELSYDKFHENYKNIYRINSESFDLQKNSTGKTSQTPSLLVFGIMEKFPEVKDVVRIKQGSAVIRYKDHMVFEKNCYSADGNIFDVFSFSLFKGNPETALKNLNSVIISKYAAGKYFADEDPIGETINIAGADYIITGILNENRGNSHLKFDFLTPMRLPTKKETGNIMQWLLPSVYTYVLLKENYPFKSFEEKVNTILGSYIGQQFSFLKKFSLQPLSDIHLYSKLNYGIASQGEIRYVYVFSVIAFIILIIACVNFVNISVGLSFSRMTEVGIRKIVGAKRSQLVQQFWGEFLLFGVISIITGLVLTNFALPLFNNITDRELSFSANIPLIAGICFLLLLTGLIAGSYPSLVLSGIQPWSILRYKPRLGGRHFISKVLVVFQFLIPSVLIFSTVTMSGQLKKMRSDVGYNSSHLLILSFNNYNNSSNNNRIYGNFKNEITGNDNIISVSGSSYHPGRSRGMVISSPISFHGNTIQYTMLEIDYGFIKTLGIELLEGREFSEKYPSDKYRSVIINETFAKSLEKTDLIGREVDLQRREAEMPVVVGIMKDFHIESFKKEISPLVLTYTRSPVQFIFIRTKHVNLEETINFLREKWGKVAPDMPFEYSFMNDDLAEFYLPEIKIARTVKYASVLSILIACLGVFGLTSLTINQNRKQISIRKIFGANKFNILKIFSTKTAKLIFIGNIIAFPAAYYLMNKWLTGFVYKTQISVWTFLVTFLITGSLAMLTIVFLIIKAANSNAVENLRYE